ncbi:MAG TPA: class I SAM-dependent methyltransferase [Ferruginibacter sp.]|nr:class I SAM-dependent methyltransferase [Ferruginibacter sp.]
MKSSYKDSPVKYVDATYRSIALFPVNGENIDEEVVRSFGDEWTKFHDFSDETINDIAREYFDILDNGIVNKNTYALDIGCGTGRWTKYLSAKAGFIEAVDPSNAIFAADKLLGNIDNVRLTKASTETIPFEDNTFDFAMSVGVLHHIPNTQNAMKDCVKKVKMGGYFYCYIYHNLETRGGWFKTLFWMSDLIRKVVCRLPAGIKRVVCDLLAIFIYMPLILWVRLLALMGLKNLATKMPLAAYNNKSFFVIRNDALDKFGTSLEQRFSKKQVVKMMRNCGLDNIVVSPLSPFYHAIGKKVR